MKSTDAPTSAPIPPKPAVSRWKPVVMMLVAGGVGGILGFTLVRWLPGLMQVGEYSKLQKLGVVALCAPAIVFGIFVHELGHVAGGKLAGFRFLLLLVGPLKLQRTPAGLRLGLNWSANLVGGLACLLPEDDRQLKRRMALFIAGGPGASLLLGLGAGLGGWAWYGSFTPLQPPGYGALAGALGLVITGAISTALFAVSAWPGSAGGFATDGRRLAMLLQPGERAEQEAALTMLLSASISGVRARDYPPHLVARVAAGDEGSLFGLMGKLMAYYHALDRGEPEVAGEFLRPVVTAVETLPRITRDAVHAEHAYWLVCHRGDLAGAQAALARAGRCEFDPATKLRAEAAVLRAAGDQAAATAKADEALVALRRKSLSLKPPAEQVEWIEALRA